MNLTQAQLGKRLTITGTSSNEILLQTLRLGIDEGAEIKIQKKIPGGPVIISKNHLEIAIGRQMALSIHVRQHD